MKTIQKECKKCERDLGKIDKKKFVCVTTIFEKTSNNEFMFYYSYNWNFGEAMKFIDGVRSLGDWGVVVEVKDFSKLLGNLDFDKLRRIKIY